MEQQAKQMELHSQQHRAEMEQQAKQLELHSQQHRAEMEQQTQQMELHSQQHRAEMEQQTQQMEQHSQQHRAEMEQQAQHHREEMHNLLKILDVQKHGTGEDDSSTHHHQLATAAIPPFAAFDSTSELWLAYRSRFCTFVEANAVPEQRQAQVFLTNQTAAVYKQLANLATQQTPPKDINKLTMSEIVNFMKEQFDPKLFIVRERFKFWSDMQRKPGETLQELAALIRQDAATCDFPSIEDPQDEALRQRFICSVNNEAVLKALFKVGSTRNRRRVLSRTISSLIPKTSRSATDVDRSTKHRTAPTKKPSVISVTKRDIWKLFARRSNVKNRDVLPKPIEEDHKSWTCESNPRWSFSRYS